MLKSLSLNSNFETRKNINIGDLEKNQNSTSLKPVFTGKDSLQISSSAKLSLPSIYSKGKHVSLVSFSGKSEKTEQGKGVFIHMANLPPSSSNSPIGELVGKQTDEYIDFLVKSKQNLWAINPLTPFGKDLCPYNASSRFERSPYYINQERFFDKDYQLLKESDRAFFDEHKYQRKEGTTDNFTLEDCQSHKDPIFKRAYVNFIKAGENHPLRPEFNSYIKEEGPKWLDNNAVYTAIQSYIDRGLNSKIMEKSGDNLENRIEKKLNEHPDNWTSWREGFKTLPENPKYKNAKTLDEKLNVLNEVIKKEGGRDLGVEDVKKAKQFQFNQFLFDHQFKELKGKLDNKGIRMLVDLAYAVSPAGSDVWANKNIVMLNEENQPAVMTGCMPEPAYPLTQMWGQAVWNYESEDFWKYSENVMSKTLDETGAVRLDHFGGLINRGAIPTKLNGADIKETLIKAYEGGNDFLKNNLMDMLNTPDSVIQEKIGEKIDTQNLSSEKLSETLDKIFDSDKDYKTAEITKKKEDGGTYGLQSFWKNEWLEDVFHKPNLHTGEKNLIDTYLRVAAQKGLDLNNVFVLEDLGGVGTTKLFQQEFLPVKFAPEMKNLKNVKLSEEAVEKLNGSKGNKYQDMFSFFRSPVIYGMGDPSNSNIHNPYGFANNDNANGYFPKTTTAITSNHDSESFLENIKANMKFSSQNFEGFLSKLINKDDPNKPARKVMQDVMEKYFYNPQIGFKNVVISLNDAIGVMRRPNIPGSTNEGKDVNKAAKFEGYDMETPKSGNIWLWGFTFNPGFLTKPKTESGYQERAEEFINMQNRIDN